MKKSMPSAALLDNRACLRLSGEDAMALLQGLVSNDLNRLTPDRAIYTTLLTPQGKFLFDFFVHADGAALILETAGDRLADLERRLTLYRLRSDVTIEPVEPAPLVAVLFGDGAAALADLPAEPGATRETDGLTWTVDPRLPALGVRLRGAPEAVRARLDAAGLELVDATDFNRHRITLAVPEAGSDLIVDRSILLEAGLDQLNGVAFDKGCFVGQELTARTRYRGLVKRRLVPVELVGASVEPGFAIMAGEVEAGEIRSTTGDLAMALLRLDRLGGALEAGGGAVLPRPAFWQTDLIERLAETLEQEKG
jgi:folate-binding protein YgfZ